MISLTTAPSLSPRPSSCLQQLFDALEISGFFAALLGPDIIEKAPGEPLQSYSHCAFYQRKPGAPVWSLQA